MRRVIRLFALPLVLGAVVLRAGEVEVPESFRKAAPLYPGSTVALSMKTGDGTQVHLECQGKAKEVVEFYRKEMKERGWTESAVMEIPNGNIAAFQKDGGSLAVTALQGEGGKTSFTLTLTKE